MNGAIKPCQSPSQKPATPPWSMGVPLDWFAVGAHPVRMVTSNRARTSRVKGGLIAISPVHRTTNGGREKSQRAVGWCSLKSKIPQGHGVRGGARRILDDGDSPLGDLWWQSRVTIMPVVWAVDS
jgi:hypothetical protein